MFSFPFKRARLSSRRRSTSCKRLGAAFRGAESLEARAMLAVTIDWVTVGDAGNAADDTGYGAVSHEYRIGKYEVTIGQYAEFLNAAAKSDPYGLWHPNMATDLTVAGISRIGSSGSYEYALIGPSGLTPPGASSVGSRPITYVSWFDAARFTNWLHNGQGTGSTETGAYTLVGGQTSGTAPEKNAGAQFYIPTESEWYKAAFYKGGGINAGYWEYATQSDTPLGNAIGSGTNQSNVFDGDYSVTQSSTLSASQNYLTEVGAFFNSASAYGTFDQSGNVREWNDLSGQADSFRGARGDFWGIAFGGHAQHRLAINSNSEGQDLGFRLASIPNRAPADVALSSTMVPENQPSGTAVGTLSTTDPDIGERFSYSLVSGTGSTDNALFQVVGNELRTAAQFDFESRSSCSVRIRSTDQDGLFTEKSFSISVSNVNEAPTAISLTNVTASLPENTATTIRIKVADIVVTDDALGTNNLSLAGSDAASFEIDGLVLYLKAGTVLNFEAKTAYAVTVIAQDATVSGSSVLAVNYALAITDVPEAPTPPRVSAPAFFTVVEDTPTALVFSSPPFSDSESPVNKAMTVTIGVVAGTLAATSAEGVTVAGTATARTFTGTLANLNAYFTSTPGRLGYTPLRNSTATTTLSITITERHGGRKLTSRGSSRLQIVAVNDAPVVFAPPRFVVREDTRTNLLWPASPAGFTDVDSSSLTVTVSVPDGTLFAATGGGVSVAGTPTARTLTGTPSALTAYFRTLGRIAYLPALDNNVARMLTTTVTDGVETRVATSTVAITPVNDAPRILAAAVINGSSANAPVEITYDQLRTASSATDVELPNPSLVIQTVLSGTLQRWSGTAWVRVSTAVGAPLAQRTLQPGQRLRWIPPTGSTGLQNAFRATARDGVTASAVACTVRISIA